MSNKTPFFRRHVFQSRVNSFVMALIVIGIIILLNFIASRYNVHFDVTENQEFTLSAQTIKIIEELKEPVRILGFFKAVEKPLFEDLTDKYRYHSDKISVQFVDPDVEAALTKRYGVDKYRTIVVEMGAREGRADDATEEKLTEAIIKASRTERKEICFLQGHGEKKLEDAERDGYKVVKEELEKSSYRVKSFSFLEDAALPESCRVLVIAGATKPLFPNEIPLLKGYVEKGGKLLLLADPQTESGVGELVVQWGITLHNDVIVDMRARILGADYTVPVVTDYPRDHPITEDFNVPTFFPLARSLALAPSLPKGVKAKVLAQTSANSWGETTLQDGKAKYDEGKDFRGPLPIAVALEIEGREDMGNAKKGEVNDEDSEISDFSKEKGKETEGAKFSGKELRKQIEELPAGHPERKDTQKGESEVKKAQRPLGGGVKKVGNVIVFGNSNFADNQYFRFSGNGDLFLNTMSFLTEDTGLISIRPKPKAEHRIFLSPFQWAMIGWGVRWALPFMIVLAGLAVWWRRRKL